MPANIGVDKLFKVFSFPRLYDYTHSESRQYFKISPLKTYEIINGVCLSTEITIVKFCCFLVFYIPTYMMIVQSQAN